MVEQVKSDPILKYQSDPIFMLTYTPNISSYMKTSIKTLRENKSYIINTLITNYTNGVIEGIINKIKVIKRIAFGYRSFYHFKLRILILIK
jgi:transposase